jgi:hypothetical protein
MILNVDLEVDKCVYKIFHGRKYLIIKAKNLASSIYLLEKGFASYIAQGGGKGRDRGGAGQNEWDGVNTYYMQFYKWVYDHPDKESKIEVLIESDNAYELLKTEQIELRKAMRDKKCLNSNLNAYIPKYRTKSASYGWIDKGSVLAFKKYLKNNP